MNSDKFKLIQELDAMIDQAWGKGHEGCAIRKDPALGRNLEWIKEALQSAAELLIEIMEGEVNPEDEAEKFVKEFLPEYLRRDIPADYKTPPDPLKENFLQQLKNRIPIS